MIQYARMHASDEIWTVRNTVAQLYLILRYCCHSEKLNPNSVWLNRLGRPGPDPCTVAPSHMIAWVWAILALVSLVSLPFM